MLRKDGTVEGSGNLPSSMELLVQVGITNDYRLAVFWPNDRLRHDIINKLTPEQLRQVKDALITAFNDSVNKRIPTVINIS